MMRGSVQLQMSLVGPVLDADLVPPIRVTTTSRLKAVLSALPLLMMPKDSWCALLVYKEQGTLVCLLLVCDGSWAHVERLGEQSVPI